MILVLVPRITARLSYTCKLVLNTLLGCQFRFTTNVSDFAAYDGVKFSYGSSSANSGLHFQSAGLLFETGIGNLRLDANEHEGVKTIFPVFNPGAALPFDPFAATFFMVSRYEEHLPYIKDQYGRFPVFESLAYKQGFLNRPVVNLWANLVSKTLSLHFRGFTTKKSQFTFIPTYDIDQAWAFLSKGLARNAGAIIKMVAYRQFPAILHRLKVLVRTLPDPFDTYDYQHDLQQQYGLKPVYFILFAPYGQYDRGIPTQSVRYRQLIKLLSDHADVGIHPSFASFDDAELLQNEIKALAAVLNREITCSRQHYLKLSFPETYRQLAALDITRDYTMGFAARPGFRAGICIPYRFYDIGLETETHITVFPFAVMDGTLRDYMELSPEQAIPIVSELIHEVKAVDGTFSSLWHNDSLSETGRWIGWRQVYEELVKQAAT